DLVNSPGGADPHHILEDADKAVWDRRTRTFRYFGQGHLSQPKFIKYNDDTNTWTTETQPPWAFTTDFRHAYHHNAYNPFLGAQGPYYFREYNSGLLRIYNVATGVWSNSANDPDVAVQCCGALEYFPEMGRILFFGDQNGSFGMLKAYDAGANSWSQL